MKLEKLDSMMVCQFYFILVCNEHSRQTRENNNIEKQWKKNYKHY